MPDEPILRIPPGPKPYAAILESPHRSQIDERLFTQRHSARSVWHWLTSELGVESISYVTLTRYKNSSIGDRSKPLEDVRREEVLKDLEVLGAIVQRGEEALEAGYLPRMSELLKAIELRAQLLARFPDGIAE